MNQLNKISKNINEAVLDNPKTPNKNLKWTYIVNARKTEIEYLRKKFNFKLSHLRLSTSTSTSQRPIVENIDNYLFLILHFPFFKDGNITSGEIDFYLLDGNLVTIHNNDLKPLVHFFSLFKKDSPSLLSYQFESPVILLYEILNKLILAGYDILDQNSIAINNIESIIFSENQKTAVSELLNLKRNIINIRKIMQNHKNIFKKIMNIDSGSVPEAELKEHFKKLIEHSKTFWEILDNQKEMVEALHQTNESMLNYRISDIMKTLTIFSVIVFPLTLLAALFGMNTTGGMPFITNPNGFWIIMSIMTLSSLLMLLFFEKKRWL